MSSKPAPATTSAAAATPASTIPSRCVLIYSHPVNSSTSLFRERPTRPDQNRHAAGDANHGVLEGVIESQHVAGLKRHHVPEIDPRSPGPNHERDDYIG